MIVRQGDLLLRKVEKLPKQAKIVKSDVILEGEATGHVHRIMDGEIFRLWEEINLLWEEIGREINDLWDELNQL